MVEVVFSQSTKESMTLAKRNNNNSPKDLISNIGFYLDIGDISGMIDGIERREVFTSIFSSDFDEQEYELFFQMQSEDLKNLIAAAKKGESIRIWKSYTAFSACGFAYVCHLLKNINCKISVVSLPEIIVKDGKTSISYTSWSEVPPMDLYSFLSYEKVLSTIEKNIYSDLWNDLKAENSPLRANVNGKLISVPENFYDHILIRNIPKGKIIMDEYIGRIIGSYPIGVCAGWYKLRIKKQKKEKFSKKV